MTRTVSIGNQDFESIRMKNCFYVDKTNFIKEWWENEDTVTLITRPRRFGKTLTISMLEQFFSNRYADRGIYLRDCLSGNIQSIRNYRGLIQSSVCPLPMSKKAVIKVSKGGLVS